MSSARAVRCKVKSLNERNPLCYLPGTARSGYYNNTAGDEPEEGVDDVKSSRPLCPGLHTCDNGRYNELQCSNAELISKAGPSTDRGLKLTLVKMELLVNASQPYCVEYVPGPCTHRPSHHPSWLHPKTHTLTARKGVLKVWSVRRVKS